MIAAPPRAATTLTASPAPVLRLDGVERRHANGRGVGPVSVRIDAGERVAVMGRNGAGKTTLLRMLATVHGPASGTLRWFTGASPAVARHDIGFAPDVVAEEGSLTARQATHFWCRQWRSAADAGGLVGRALSEFGLDAVADEPVSRFSFGMRRRLALAQALVHEPRLLLLDEPTAGLDPEGVTALKAALLRRCARGATAVVATNDCEFVASACDRVLFLHDGRLARDASPGELLAEVGPGRRAELQLRGPCDAAALRALPGVASTVSTDDGCSVEMRDDSALASLVAVADSPGGNLRSLRVRVPDLADAFRHVTGAPLGDGESA